MSLSKSVWTQDFDTPSMSKEWLTLRFVAVVGGKAVVQPERHRQIIGILKLHIDRLPLSMAAIGLWAAPDLVRAVQRGGYVMSIYRRAGGGKGIQPPPSLPPRSTGCT